MYLSQSSEIIIYKKQTIDFATKDGKKKHILLRQFRKSRSPWKGREKHRKVCACANKQRGQVSGQRLLQARSPFTSSSHLPLVPQPYPHSFYSYFVRIGEVWEIWGLNQHTCT